MQASTVKISIDFNEGGLFYMNNNENINWRETVAGFSSYEGALGNFCNENHITKSQFYCYKKKMV